MSVSDHSTSAPASVFAITRALRRSGAQLALCSLVLFSSAFQSAPKPTSNGVADSSSLAMRSPAKLGPLPLDSSALEPCTARQPVATERCQLRAKIDSLAGAYNIGAKGWSFGYHACLILALVLGSLAAFLAKVDDSGEAANSAAGTQAANGARRRRTLAAASALGAALLTSVSSAGGFPAKWRASRDARTDAQVLHLRATDPRVDVVSLRESLVVIIRRHDSAINDAESN